MNSVERALAIFGSYHTKRTYLGDGVYVVASQRKNEGLILTKGNQAFNLTPDVMRELAEYHKVLSHSADTLIKDIIKNATK